MALLLNRGDVQALLNIEDAIDVVEAAFGELASGTAVMPAAMSDAADRMNSILTG